MTRILYLNVNTILFFVTLHQILACWLQCEKFKAVSKLL